MEKDELDEMNLQFLIVISDVAYEGVRLLPLLSPSLLLFPSQVVVIKLLIRVALVHE